MHFGNPEFSSVYLWKINQQCCKLGNLLDACILLCVVQVRIYSILNFIYFHIKAYPAHCFIRVHFDILKNRGMYLYTIYCRPSLLGVSKIKICYTLIQYPAYPARIHAAVAACQSHLWHNSALQTCDTIICEVSNPRSIKKNNSYKEDNENIQFHFHARAFLDLLSDILQYCNLKLKLVW